MTQISIGTDPEVSIVLCTYNRAPHLPRAISSVVAQTFTHWELVIVDDGSDDDTFSVVSPYIDQFDNVRFIKHKNRKQAYSKNVGIQSSFGKYITFLDSDDAYLVNHLESRIEYMKNHPDIDLVEGGFFADEEIWVADYFQPGKTINARDCVLGATLFGKRDVFYSLHGFNDFSYGEDTDLWSRAEQVFKTRRITEPQTYLYTRAETSVSKSALKKNV